MTGFRVGGLAALTVLLGAWGCGGSTTTPTNSTPVTYPQITESYSGSINIGETKPFHFAVTNPGSLDTAITSLSPVSTLTMGLYMGAWDALSETCTRSTIFTEAARVNVSISGTPQQAGEYCVAIYDIGNLQSPTDFTVTVLHY
jgi:hypothetical protein